MSYQHPVFEIGRSGGPVKSGGSVRLCPACGETLIGGRCPECTPAAPARSYVDGSLRTGLLGFGPEPREPRSVDARRATSEWLKAETDHDPHTRKAHPTQVRTALAEAEERARERTLRESLTHGVSIERPRRGRTPVPPAPSAAAPTAVPQDEAAPRAATDPWLAKAPATTTPPSVPDPAPPRQLEPLATSAPAADALPATQPEPPGAFPSEPPASPAEASPPLHFEAPRAAPAEPASARADAHQAQAALAPASTSKAPIQRAVPTWLVAGLVLAGLTGLLAAVL